jgi:hypothetical protein
MAQALTTEERSNLLQREIQKYVKDGWRVQSSTATTAQLVKPKKFSFLFFIVLLILMVLPALLYVVWFAVKRDEAVYLSVDENGRITRNK